MGPHSVTVLFLVPSGHDLSQWTFGSMRFCTQQWSLEFQSVTMDSWFHKALLCHSDLLDSTISTKSLYKQGARPWSPWIRIFPMYNGFLEVP